MTNSRLIGWFCLLGLGLNQLSCSTKYEGPKINKVDVVKVQGKVTVDGEAQEGIIIRPVAQGGAHNELAGAFVGKTDSTGAFALGTYEVGDGIPPGNYVLTFVWPEVGFKKQSRKDELKSDRLKGKYADASKSTIKIEVKPDEPLNLEETINLTIK